MTEKQCSKCKEVKPVSEFPKHLTNKDRLAGRCKACKHERQRILNQKEENKSKRRERDKIRRSTDEYREYAKARMAIYRKTEKNQAYRKAYQQTKEYKARNAAFCKKYKQRPEVKDRLRKYHRVFSNSPEQKAKKKARGEDYYCKNREIILSRTSTNHRLHKLNLPKDFKSTNNAKSTVSFTIIEGIAATDILSGGIRPQPSHSE